MAGAFLVLKSCCHRVDNSHSRVALGTMSVTYNVPRMVVAMPCKTWRTMGLRNLSEPLEEREAFCVRYGRVMMLPAARTGRRIVRKVRAGLSGRERVMLVTCS